MPPRETPVEEGELEWIPVELRNTEREPM